MRYLAPLVLAVFANAAAAQKASDWPQFRGPSGNGVSDDARVPLKWGPNENVVWKESLPGSGASTPVIFGDRIYLSAYSGYGVPRKPRGSMEDLTRLVLCLDRETGKSRWLTEVTSRLPDSPSTRDDHGYATSSPVVDAERVYVFFGKSGVVALSHAGRHLWYANVGDGLNGWGSAASPLLHGDLVIINASVESESLVALDKKSGKEVWRARGIRESWNTPIVVDAPGGQQELVVAIMGKVLGFDPATGEQLWSCNTDIGWYMVPSLVAKDGIVYCVGGRGGGGSLAVRAGGRGDVTRTHRLWKSSKGTNVPSPILHGGHLYWANEALGVAYCADAKSGKILYEERLGGENPVYASPVLVGGKLIYLSRQGRAFVLPAAPRFEVEAVNTLGERAMFNASPAVAGDRLYIRSDQTLYCIGTK